MTATTPTAPADPAPIDGRSPVPLPVKILAGLLALACAALIGYGIGRHRDTGSDTLTGRAYLGASQGTVIVDGWAYGFDISPNSMRWFDARGGFHDGGIPPCLQHRPGHAWIRFGYSTAHGLDGSGWRSVDWVQCLPHRS